MIVDKESYFDIKSMSKSMESYFDIKSMSKSMGVQYYAFEHLTNAGIKHGFSTRIGGVSKGRFASLNFGYSSGDCVDAVKQNYNLFCNALGVDSVNIVTGVQVHGTNIEIADGTKTKFESTDGLMTDKKDVVLTTYYADCVPLLFYDPIKRVIANAHAGWRGCAMDMAGKVIFAMKQHFNCDPANILAGIGPSISVKNFEVSEDVVQEFKKMLPFSQDFIYNSEIQKNKYHVDLWGVCQKSMINAGLLTQNIEVAGLCTFENKELFHSHRRDGLPRGSMIAIICL